MTTEKINIVKLRELLESKGYIVGIALRDIGEMTVNYKLPDQEPQNIVLETTYQNDKKEKVDKDHAQIEKEVLQKIDEVVK